MPAPRHTWVIALLGLLLVAAVPRPAPTVTRKMREDWRRAGAVEIRTGSSRFARCMGFGWGRREPLSGRWARWILHLEADVVFEPVRVADSDLRVTAAPLYLNWKQQNIGVYVNGRYVGEWLCAAGPEFSEHHMVVPKRFLKEGENTLTLRMGYRRRSYPDRRLLALAVREIVLKPR